LVQFWRPWKIIFGIFPDPVVHFEVICFILWQFGTFCGHWLIFTHFGMLYQKIWQPWTRGGKN
jgi:hypothetical protein